jgi:O-antigen ligase
VRITDTIKAFTSKGTMRKEDIADLNSSSFALYSNYLVAQTSFNRSPVFGCGLGNHEHVSNAVFEELLGKQFIIRFGNFNAKDANSLAIRVMSEGGLLGLILLLIALFRPFVWIRGIDNRRTVLLTIMNQAVFIMFVVRIVRTGNYISQGFMFFLFLYVYSKMQIRERLADETSPAPASSENALAVQ